MLLAIVSAVVLQSAPGPLQVGSTAPDFTAVDTEGKSYRLSELVKKGPVVVAFFPKAFTPGCTKEMKAFGERNGELAKKGALVLAVSVDDRETLRKFKADLKAPQAFISDPELKLARLLGASADGAQRATRVTYTFGAGRKVLAVQTGAEAIDPSGAIAACGLKR